ncbi:phosphatase 2C [Dipsacomyces acuminosporus]|nr:phosphatase 2C [Dipsacomyces acuminosporus]
MMADTSSEAPNIGGVADSVAPIDSAQTPAVDAAENNKSEAAAPEAIGQPLTTTATAEVEVEEVEVEEVETGIGTNAQQQHPIHEDAADDNSHADPLKTTADSINPLKDTASKGSVVSSRTASAFTGLLSNSNILPRPKLQRSPIPPPIDTENANKDAESCLRSKLLADESPTSSGNNESSDAAPSASAGAEPAEANTQAHADGAAAAIGEQTNNDGNAQAHIGVSFSKNRRYRRTMEDAHFHRYGFDGVSGQSLMAVFDGHAGRQAAQWCGDNFADIFLQLKEENPEISVPALLNMTFLEVDRRLADEVKTHSGCTAVVAFLEIKNDSTGENSGSKRTLYCANVGDARAVLSRNGTATRLTYDHKGDDIREAQRISECGGYVFNGRVNGILAVTRALGDSSLKPFVIGNPFTTETHLQDTDDLLILACDGLWDVCTDQEAIDLIRDDNDPVHASQVLLDYALDNESMDNITTLVFRLPKAESPN